MSRARAEEAKPRPQQPYLSIRNLSKRFEKFTALDSVDLDIAEGEFVSILGPSGCGKTTLLRAVAGLDVQTSGTVHQGGRDISNLPVSGRDFGIVFQSYALFPNLTIAANVGYGLKSGGYKSQEIEKRVTELLDLVGLADQAKKYPAQLSGGQQQRVALARALALAPGLLLLDEPLSALDARVRARLRGEIRDLQRRLGITTVMVTHDQEEALTMSDRVVVMSKGRIEQIGTPDEIYGRPASAFVADFVGRMNFIPGSLLSDRLVEVKGAKLGFAEPVGLGKGSAVTVCIRPEDVVLHRGNGSDPNRLDAQIGVMEFVGNHFSTVLHAENTNLNISADFSMNDVREFGLASGKTVPIRLPPECLREFSPIRPPPRDPMTAVTPTVLAPVRQKISYDELIMRIGVVILGCFLLLAVILPMSALLKKAFEDKSGAFVGLANIVQFFTTPSLATSTFNSIFIAVVSTILCVGLAFVYAYGLTRCCLPARGFFRIVSQIPLLAPSLLPAISLVYLFGNQGFATWLLFGHSIYGPIGIVIGEVFWTFPHALIIVTTALAIADARHFEAAQSLKASEWRIFLTVTLPGIRYGLISATFVVFVLVITDFGVPKVIGEQYSVLATDIYKQVIGQQNFQMGAVVGLVLLTPAIIAFFIDRIAQRRQTALLSARAVPLIPKPNPRIDWAFFAICSVIAAMIIIVLAVAFIASIAKFWPYDLTPSLKNYNFDMMDGGGWESYRNSLTMSALTAVLGTAIIFTGAYLLEKTTRFGAPRSVVRFLTLLPLAVPGLVLGLGFIFFFNDKNNPLNFIYGTMAILVLCTIGHFYSVAHLTATTALKQIDPEFETVSSSLKVPIYKTFVFVTLPVCLPAVLEIAMYLFVNAMTTVSAVVFLYSPKTTLASIAVLNMDDAGDVAPAAAMAIMIFLTSAMVRIVYTIATGSFLRRAQAWRRR